MESGMNSPEVFRTVSHTHDFSTWKVEIGGLIPAEATLGDPVPKQANRSFISFNLVL